MFRGCLLQNGFAALALILGLMTAGCVSTPGKMLRRRGDEIMVAGQLFHTGTRVVLWTDPGGFDAYRVERRFAPWEQAGWDNSRTNPASPRTPNRYGVRASGLSQAELERVRGGGWDLALLRRQVDQLVLHYDAVGTSRGCFKVLQDERGLSTHFLLDLDGTIYQTLDVKERAYHATTSNDRAVGVEIANLGAFAENQTNPFARWYQTNGSGRTIITIPGGAQVERTPNFEGRPVRRGVVTGEVQGQELRQYDFTAEQVPGAGAADGGTLHGAAQDSLRLSARCRGQIGRRQTAGRAVEGLRGRAWTLAHPDRQSGSGAGLAMGLCHRRGAQADEAADAAPGHPGTAHQLAAGVDQR